MDAKVDDSSLGIYSGAVDTDTLGGRLSRAREAAGYTMGQLSRAIGVRKDTLAAWEHDRSEPRANRLVTLAGVLGVSPAWLLSGIGEPPAGNGSSPLHRELIAEIERLKGIHQQAETALATIREMAGRLAAEQAAERSA